MTDSSLVEDALEYHAHYREQHGLVPRVPKRGNIVCPDCGNHCRISEGEIGFCHLKSVNDGVIVDRYHEKAVVSWYFDPLPTNCVADWVCPVRNHGTETSRTTKRMNNLAVFYGSCNSDCLFCQNASYRDMMREGKPLMSPEELAAAANERTACICYFGGDPACNPAHSIETSELLNTDRDIAVCYETNGNISRKWLEPISQAIEEYGGTIKFDLKAVTPQVYTALTGISNTAVLNNFRRLAKRGKKREGEFLVASILLIPGYVNLPEIKNLCEFIVSCDPSVPTALLGFHPHQAMSDLPRTSKAHAKAAEELAVEVGLTNVRIGNIGLLSTNEYGFH